MAYKSYAPDWGSISEVADSIPDNAGKFQPQIAKKINNAPSVKVKIESRNHIYVFASLLQCFIVIYVTPAHIHLFHDMLSYVFK